MRFVKCCQKASKTLGIVAFLVATLVLYSDYIPIEIKLVIKTISIVALYLTSIKMIKWSGEMKKSIENDPDGIKKGMAIIRSDITELLD